MGILQKLYNLGSKYAMNDFINLLLNRMLPVANLNQESKFASYIQFSNGNFVEQLRCIVNKI